MLVALVAISRERIMIYKQSRVRILIPLLCFSTRRAVWHQADPITKGTRWALVIFYKVHKIDRFSLSV
jgi:hypothetical protein